MYAATLLSTLRARDVKLWIDGSCLKCSAPVGALDAGLREELASCKHEIIAFLRHAEALNSGPASIVPIKADGGRPPIFAVSGHGGDVFWLRPLARHLHPEQPMIGVQPPGLDGTEPLDSLAALARYQIEQIRRYRPRGPYLIAGHCAGGTLAFEVAQQLVAAGQEVALLALIGSPFPTMFSRAALIWIRLSGYTKVLKPAAFRRKLLLRLERKRSEAAVPPAELRARQRVERATVAAVRSYRPRHYAGRVDVFVTADKWHRSHLWRGFAGTFGEHHLAGGFEVKELLLGPNVNILAASIQARLDQVSDPDSHLRGVDRAPEAKAS